MSPDHQRAFDDVQELWGKLGELPFLPDAPEPEALSVDQYRGEERVRVWRQTRTTDRGTRRWPFALAAGILLMVSVGFGTWINQQAEPTPAINYQTVISQHQTITLPDGSVMELGAASRAEVRFDAKFRGIELLNGIAYFDVVHNAQRPFVVRAAGGTVTAIGTAFTVQQRDNEVTVVVSDGLVEVEKSRPAPTVASKDASRNPASLQLPAGQQVVFSSGQGLDLPQTVNVAAATAWREGRLVFQDESLVHAVADINRYSHIPIEISDSDLASLRLTGTVVTTQIEGWLDGLESVLPITVTRHPDRIALSARPAAHTP